MTESEEPDAEEHIFMLPFSSLSTCTLSKNKNLLNDVFKQTIQYFKSQDVDAKIFLSPNKKFIELEFTNKQRDQSDSIIDPIHTY